jgi:hypothetical protein
VVSRPFRGLEAPPLAAQQRYIHLAAIRPGSIKVMIGEAWGWPGIARFAPDLASGVVTKLKMEQIVGNDGNKRVLAY